LTLQKMLALSMRRAKGGVLPVEVSGFSGLIVAAEGDAQVFADASGKKLFNIAMNGYYAAGSCLCIAIEGM
jgi:hypothetical protein